MEQLGDPGYSGEIPGYLRGDPQLPWGKSPCYLKGYPLVNLQINTLTTCVCMTTY